MFPYLEKYLVTEYLPKLVARMEYAMKQINYSTENVTLCDRALLLDYKAELFYMKKEYANALKKMLLGIIWVTLEKNKKKKQNKQRKIPQKC